MKKLDEQDLATYHEFLEYLERKYELAEGFRIDANTGDLLEPGSLLHNADAARERADRMRAEANDMAARLRADADKLRKEAPVASAMATARRHPNTFDGMRKDPRLASREGVADVLAEAESLTRGDIKRKSRSVLGTAEGFKFEPPDTQPGIVMRSKGSDTPEPKPELGDGPC